MEIKITELENEQRFDRYLRKYFKNNAEVKLSDIFSRIRKGVIKVNGKKVKENYRLQINDVVLIDNEKSILKDPSKIIVSKDEKIISIDLDFLKSQIIYEDDDRIVWNKPHGIVVHPGNKHLNDLTLNDYLESYVKSTNAKKSSTFKPSFGFRLDRDTSGLIIGAKNYESLKYLNELIRNRETDKTYLAIVKGKFPDELTMDSPIFRGFNKKFGRAQSFVNFEQGKTAKTKAWLIKSINNKYLGVISLIGINIYTGRMHQIRTHLGDKGFPILGDIMYGDSNINDLLSTKYRINRQLLHSWKYSFYNKFNKNNVVFKSEFPDDFKLFFKTIKG